MKKTLIIAAALGTLGVLAGCEDTGTASSGSGLAPAASALRTGSPADEGACERAVSFQTNNGDAITLSSTFSEANTVVIVGVGPERARWRCLVSNGVVAEVMSLTNEGTL